MTAPKKAKKPAAAKNPAAAKKPAEDLLSVSAVARELAIDPKAARAALREAGKKAKDGRWPKVQRGSDAHTALLLLFEGNGDGVNSAPKK